MSQKQILVVDDEATIRQQFTLVLEKAGYAVDTVASGEEGIERVRQTPWDLVFLDLMLPDIDGIETFKRMKAIREVLVIVLVTAYYEQLKGRLHEAWASGIQDAFLRKPLTNEDILKAVKKYLREKHS